MTRQTLIFVALIAGSLGFSGPAVAQSSSATMDHSAMAQGMMDTSAMMAMDASATPVFEPGQGAFAAIAEIVAQLESDPESDWAAVDIARLREHLRDMDLVTVDAVAVAEDVDGGMMFTVTGDASVAPSIRRMTLAHATVMNGVNGWDYSARELDRGAVVTVIVPQADRPRLRALGYFGMMASGVHHQDHHWMMATGQNPHG
jgi:hypothetical protein